MDAIEKWIALGDTRISALVDAVQGHARSGTMLHLQVALEAKGVVSNHLRTTPDGYMLVKKCLQSERSWPEDSPHENGDYFNTCISCDRQFVGHKRRVVCKVCANPFASDAALTPAV